jgi:hypothetical protein
LQGKTGPSGPVFVGPTDPLIGIGFSVYLEAATMGNEVVSRKTWIAATGLLTAAAMSGCGKSPPTYQVSAGTSGEAWVVNTSTGELRHCYALASKSPVVCSQVPRENVPDEPSVAPARSPGSSSPSYRIAPLEPPDHPASAP